MSFSSVQRIPGILLLLFSLTMLPPIAVSQHYQDGNRQPFIEAFAALLTIGAIVVASSAACTGASRPRRSHDQGHPGARLAP